MAASYKAIDAMIAQVKSAYGAEHKISVMFENCIKNTLDTTIKYDEAGRIFVITGDIPAMWLRDSACQLRPFLLFAKEEPEIRRMICDLVRRQMDCILIDAYANAFNIEANGNGFQDDHTQMKPELWERKYEIDSLCYPFQLSYLLWKNTGETSQFDQTWRTAAERMIEVFRTEQYHESRSPYLFERENCVYTDTLSRGGKGALVKEGIGLVWSGFRPSDDACTYGYLIPSNMLASVTLHQVSVIAHEVLRDEELAAKAQAFSEEIRQAIEQYAIVPGREEAFYAYEVDGFGQYNIMDDANLPSLLSMPYIGYCSPDDERYLSTRAQILCDANPYYYKGDVLYGIGSPHTAPTCVWIMSLSMRGITSASKQERQEMLELICRSDAGTNLTHESVHADHPEIYTRPWFSWSNSVFCEFVMDTLGYRVEL